MAQARTKLSLLCAARISAAFATVMTGKSFSPADFLPEENNQVSQAPKMPADQVLAALVGRYCK